MIQIDIEMPPNCYDCPMLYDGMGCIITGQGVDWNDYDEKRLSDCPLKEVEIGHYTKVSYFRPKDKTYFDMYRCSICGEEFSWDIETGINIKDYDYCPNCGSKIKHKV